MRVSYCSDLHLEFGSVDLSLFDNAEQADLLVLAGDVLVVWDIEHAHMNPNIHPNKNCMRRYALYTEFLEHVCSKYPVVVMVAGNHEHYGSYFQKTHETIRELGDRFTNFHLLESQLMFSIGDGLHLFAGTFWTDYRNEDPIVMVDAQWKMNDFRQIRDSRSGTENLSIDTVLEANRSTVSRLKQAVDRLVQANEKLLVVSHHAPSIRSAGGHSHGHLDYAYCNTFDGMIEGFDGTVLAWIHGHTHKEEDYMIGKTRVLSNPRGYIGYEYSADIFSLKWVDLAADAV